MSFRINRSSIAKKHHKNFLLTGTEGSSSARYGVKIPCKWANFNFIIVSPNLRWVGRNIYIEVLEKIPDTPEIIFDLTLDEVRKKRNIYQMDVSQDLDAFLDKRLNAEKQFNVAYDWVTKINDYGYKYLKFCENNKDGNNGPRSAIIHLLAMHNFQFFKDYLEKLKSWSSKRGKFDRDKYLHNLDIYVEYEFEGIFDEQMYITSSAQDLAVLYDKKYYDYIIPHISSIEGSDFILDRYDSSLLIYYIEAAPYLRRKGIKCLNMSFTYKDEFPAALSEMDLEELKIQRGNFTKIPESIGNLKNLKKLSISNLNISKLPKNIGKLNSLRYFEVFNCPISVIPEEITELKELQSLQFIKNKFSEFPKHLCSIKSLNFFSLIIQEEISSIPDEIGNLTNLKRLYLSENNLSSLPKSISNLNKLEIIDLSKNLFEEIPQILSDLPNLVNIDLSYNKIRKIPKEFFNISNLKVLNVGWNKLSEIHLDIQKMRKLEDLYVNNNFLNRLPESISTLKKLIIIDLQNNYFTKFPVELRGLKNLQEILLWQNKLKSFPKELLNYPNLKHTSINPSLIDQNNPIIKELQKKVKITKYQR